MPGRSQSAVLGYLDLWQELRQNFVVCCTRDDAMHVAGDSMPALRPHPTFHGPATSLGHALRLWRLRAFGGRVPTRTGDGDVVLRARDARRLASGEGLDADDAARLRAEGLVLGAGEEPCAMPPHDEVSGHDAWLASTQRLRVGRLAPNPLYAHLFAAFEASRTWPEFRLPDLDAQLRAWLPWATPLEHGRIRFGLTPYATAQRRQAAVRDHLEREPLPVAADYAAVRLRDDANKLAQARAFAASHDAPAEPSDEAARELWCLAFGQADLFVALLPA